MLRRKKGGYSNSLVVGSRSEGGVGDDDSLMLGSWEKERVVGEIGSCFFGSVGSSLVVIGR